MTRKEQLDWLCRLRSDISYMDFSIDVNVSLERKRQYRQVLSEVIKALEQEPVLDKIRAEIEQTVSRYSISREHGGMGQVEWSDRLIKESEVLEILDKYKAEQEK